MWDQTCCVFNPEEFVSLFPSTLVVVVFFLNLKWHKNNDELFLERERFCVLPLWQISSFVFHCRFIFESVWAAYHTCCHFVSHLTTYFSVCCWCKDHLGIWKLHEQQQARSSIWLPSAKLRLGEKINAVFSCSYRWLFALVAISVDNSKIFSATCCFYRSNVRLFILCWLSQAVGHQIYRPKTDTDALHRQHHPGEIPRAAILPHRAALPG